MLIGNARNRKLATLGATYNHRITLNHSVDMQYLAEVRPVLLVSDPVTNTTQNYFGPPADTTLSFSTVYISPCPTKPFTLNGTYSSGPYAGSPFTAVFTYTCSRRWTYGQGLSPLGLKVNLFPHHRLQPVFIMAAGYMFSTRPIPIPTAGSFNFTLEFGAGLELYRQRTSSGSIFGNRSLRTEYRYHHISNAFTATSNPGIDSGLFQVTFAFGR
ncbi:acyloxyacyl hydrolase [Tunturiibacter gelidiferens]|uniref:acyloxyacyl hydrolase n=1 Tax=Tunturiibacter gelidiferens TaxID=3069689 RepID=UPI003D9ABD7B